jgi:hypothetical protein
MRAFLKNMIFTYGIPETKDSLNHIKIVQKYKSEFRHPQVEVRIYHCSSQQAVLRVKHAGTVVTNCAFVHDSFFSYAFSSSFSRSFYDFILVLFIIDTQI